jgi:hypothetical protein
VNVGGCPDGSSTCNIEKGKTVAVDFLFTPPHQGLLQLDLSASFILAGVAVPIKSWDGCRGEYPCLLPGHSSMVVKFSLDISLLYPTISTVLRVRGKDKSHNSIVCFEVPIKIVK